MNKEFFEFFPFDLKKKIFILNLFISYCKT
jgi:hypothetical protein